MVEFKLLHDQFTSGFVLLAMLLGAASGAAQSPDPKVAAADAASVAAVDKFGPSDSWYPRKETTENGSMIIQAPQIDAWSDFETIEAWVAFQIKRADSDTSYYGSVRFEAETDTDIAAREVLLHSFEILEMSIKGLEEDSAEYTLARDGINALSRTIPLDLVLEYLPQDLPLGDDGELNPEPPMIFVSERPAVLLSVVGEPIFLPVGQGDVQFVLNTNWDVLRVGDDGALYMCYGERSWLTAGDIAGSWSWAKSLPSEFSSVPDDANWANVRACLPDDHGAVTPPPQDVPQVFHAAGPAELLLTDDAPEWVPIGETGLSYAANTAQELFRADGDFYFLISGRWFGAFDLNGPWTLVRELPDAFLDIPADTGSGPHPKSYIRASVPGTRESWEAALVASIPRKAEIVRGTESALNLDVGYAGDPVFAPIDTTEIELAVNSSYQVLRYEGVYYLCHNAVWLTSSGPTGPWQYADAIPASFSTIPPASPAYNTTFVKVGRSDEEVIGYEYTSGYEGMYVEDETVVSGTGYASTAATVTVTYGLYAGWGYPYYPYYWWPPTYGYGGWYDPTTGRYGEAVIGYGPYGAAGGAAVYNPQTGVYARGQAVWDSDEFAGRGFAYNPNTDTSIARNRYIDFEANEGWSQGVARRGDEWRYRQSEWQDGRMETGFESSRGTEGQVSREREGDSIVSEGSIAGDNRSATFESTWEDGQGSASIDGSEGGFGELDRTVEDGQITGSGEFTKDGKSIDSDVTRTAEGVKRDFETSEGGRGTSVRSGEDNAFVFESGSGDMYAGRDGDIYQKTDDGWSAVENPGAQASASRAQRAGGAGNSVMFGGNQTSPGVSDSQYNRRYDQLDRDYQSRQKGFDRYSSHQRGAGRASPRGGYGGRRRR